jgi:hypothetical protein
VIITPDTATLCTTIRLAIGKCRELALFNLAVDGKLRGCDLVAVRVHDA